MPPAKVGGVRRILIADASPKRRVLLRAELEKAGFDVCTEAETSRAALEAALRHRPDVCLVDAGTPGGGGIALASEVKEALPQTKVVLLHAVADEKSVMEAVRAGADGYLPESVDLARLPDVIRAVLAGEAAYPRSLLAPVLEGLGAPKNA
jgi:DNA-binding NarL/FixJ family response regulator